MPYLPSCLSNCFCVIARFASETSAHVRCPNVPPALLCASYCRHRLNINDMGFSLFFVFPAAFVTLNEAQLESLCALGRLKIWAGGIFHNAMLALVCWLVSTHGLGLVSSLQSFTLWQNIGPSGVMVQSLSPVRCMDRFVLTRAVCLPLNFETLLLHRTLLSMGSCMLETS